VTSHKDKPIPRVCAVIPTFNNAKTIASVIRGVLAVIPDVIVVNDGSTDDTGQILEQLEGVMVLRHTQNLGKGQSLAHGLEYAEKMEFTHAITLDGDGQHSPADIPGFLKAISERPYDLLIGIRDLRGEEVRRRKSRLLRTNSNFWVWVETGKWIDDTQSGLRAYPIEMVNRLVLKTRKYDYEIDILVKAIWSGTPVSFVPVTADYGPGSESHFRPLRDFAIVTHLNGCLIWQRILLPANLRRVMFLKEYREKRISRLCFEVARDVILEQSKTPASFALCIGLGVCFGILPIWGFQMILAGLVAHQLRLSKPLVLAASNISVPAAIPFILYASLLLGRFVLERRLDSIPGLGSVSQETIWTYAAEYLIGSVLLAVAAGLAAVCVSYVLARGCSLWWKWS